MFDFTVNAGVLQVGVYCTLKHTLNKGLLSYMQVHCKLEHTVYWML